MHKTQKTKAVYEAFDKLLEKNGKKILRDWDEVKKLPHPDHLAKQLLEGRL